MAGLYNMTDLQDSLTVSDLLIYANTSTNNMFGTMLCIAVFFITMMSLLRYGWREASVIAGFLTFLISLVLAFGGFVSLYLALSFIAITIFMVFIPPLLEKFI